jgi:signal transduction histidine kinase/ActR/RegA family two-component response regulator
MARIRALITSTGEPDAPVAAGAARFKWSPARTNGYAAAELEAGVDVVQDVQALVLVADPALIEPIAQVARRRSSGAVSVRLEPLAGSVAMGVAAARLRCSVMPLGCVVASEVDALLAIERGADEAAVVRGDECEIHAFLDRLALRAGIRAEAERNRTRHAHAEKLAALGTLVAGVGHEINNPLTALSLSVEAARRLVAPLLAGSCELAQLAMSREPLAPERLQALARTVRAGAASMEAVTLLDEMESASQAIADVVKDLRVFARGDDQESATVVHLPDAIEQVLRLTGREVSRFAIVECDYASDCPPLVLPRSRLSQVLMNLLVNAGHAVREVERASHRVRISTRMDDDFVALSISDTGPGIPADSLERIFDPFYTTKRQDMGTGLGLSISRAILRSLGGDLLVESVYGDGATFVCLLPRPTPESLREAYLSGPPERVSSQPSRNLAILVVDDDDRVLRACSRLLSPQCRILVAHDGQEAVELLSSGSQVDLVLTELDMPLLDGIGLHAWLSEHQPELARRMVVISDVGEHPRHAQFVASHGLAVLTKPIDSQALLRVVERLSGAAPPLKAAAQ